MAEYIASTVQTVEQNQNVLFTGTTVCGNNSIGHRNDSGLIILRGITNQCRARFKITFGGNIAIPEDGEVEAISLALAIYGEALQTTVMTVNPAAAEEFFSVSRSTYVDVPAGCCAQISVKNISEQAIDVQNANLIVERVA